MRVQCDCPEDSVNENEDHAGASEAEPDQRQRQQRDRGQGIEHRRQRFEQIRAHSGCRSQCGQDCGEQESGDISLQQKSDRVGRRSRQLS